MLDSTREMLSPSPFPKEFVEQKKTDTKSKLKHCAAREK